MTEVLPDGNPVKLDNDHEVLAYTAGRCGSSASAQVSATG